MHDYHATVCVFSYVVMSVINKWLWWLQVRRLEDTSTDINRGDRVMGVFPETTSFYRATVVKTPKDPSVSGQDGWEVVVRFDDDEDEAGKWPARRVPARFVLRANTFLTFFETEPAVEK